jgi:hypothetical protein
MVYSLMRGCVMTIKLSIDSYEAGIGAVGSLATVHNYLY